MLTQLLGALLTPVLVWWLVLLLRMAQLVEQVQQVLQQMAQVLEVQQRMARAQELLQRMAQVRGCH